MKVLHGNGLRDVYSAVVVDAIRLVKINAAQVNSFINFSSGLVQLNLNSIRTRMFQMMLQ